MLYYTKALRLDPAWAGIAMSVSVFWEAITEPVIGHLSDKTRSRWGRRHPYMLFGGLLMAAGSYLIWAVPASVGAGQLALFWYLVVVNLILRTGVSLFYIPYMALGFEMCADYQGRSRLQSIRQILNMAANLAGPALAWSFFFPRSGWHPQHDRGRELSPYGWSILAGHDILCSTGRRRHFSVARRYTASVAGGCRGLVPAICSQYETASARSKPPLGHCFYAGHRDWHAVGEFLAGVRV